MPIFEERGITHLDLHGIRHSDVDSEVLNFVHKFQYALPLIIICGNSSKMVEIVTNLLVNSEIKFSSPRFGILRIESF